MGACCSRYCSAGEVDFYSDENRYRIGAPVWYSSEEPPFDGARFEWYIDGKISGYVLNEDGDVTGYVFEPGHKLDPDNFMESNDLLLVDKVLKNVPHYNISLRWDENVPPCPIPGLDTMAPPTSLKASKEKYGDDLGFEGAKQNGLGPEMWGITKEQILAIENDTKYRRKEVYGRGDLGCMSMYEVVNEIIKPKTVGTGMGYALLMNQDEPKRAKVMVSHAWGENFGHFCKTLINSGEEGPFWICAFAIYQNEDLPKVTIERQLGPSPSTGPFATVVKQADKMVAIIPPDCDIYTRLWCVYEIFVSMKMGVPVSLHVFAEISGYVGSSNKDYYNPVMESSKNPVVSTAAKCGFKPDKKMIHAEIEKEGGFQVIDDAVSWLRIKALIEEYRRYDDEKESCQYAPVGTLQAINGKEKLSTGIAEAIAAWEEAKGKSRARMAQMSVIEKPAPAE